MQPVTVAISPTGIQYLLKELLGHQIALALQSNLEAPSYNFQPADFSFLPSGSSIENDYSKISVNISGGEIEKFSPVFSGCVQGPGGDNSQFAITMTVSNLVVNYPGGWHEAYTYQAYTWTRGGQKVKASSPDNGPHNNTYDYSVQLPTLTIQVTFQLSASSDGYKLTYSSSSADPGNPNPNIPGGSILNQQSSVCGYGAHISDATKQQIAAMNWSGVLASSLDKIFASIGESGQLGPVTFDFLAPGDTPLVFPSGGGIQIGAEGLVSVNGSAYPVTPPADLPFPPVPTGNPVPHATYLVQDYELDALCWGFFRAGVLKATLAHGDLSDPQALETETYRGGSLNILAVTYPKSFMTADLQALQTPTVSFTTIYEFTDKSVAKIQQDLGSAVWDNYGSEIRQLNPGTYSSQAGLEQQLQAIDPTLMTYAAVIEQDTAVPGVVAQHTVQCVLNVLKVGGASPVITFDVAQTFAMQGLRLGLSSTGKTQSVIFTFIQPEDIFPQPTFVSSTLKGVNSADFGDVWNALRPNWQNTFSAIGTAGLPLPRIPGFDFLFDAAVITLKPAVGGVDGYISITTNFNYSLEHLAPAVREMLAQQKVLCAA